MAASSSTSASASTATHSNNNQWHEIFINHRGVDVKKTFAKNLYNRLRDIGLRAFLDEDEMQTGYGFPPQIERAIVTASVHVAIFSPRYAESYWCLKELVLMLESHKLKMVPIIPVFYGVTPAEVLWTKGKYAQALQNLAEKKNFDPQTDEEKLRYDSNTIENWRNALSLVADFSGFELEACNIGKELEKELLDKMVKRLSEIVKKPDLPVAKYQTGLDYKLKDFEDTVLLRQKQQSGKPHLLGIVGSGGVGKTTFAKRFFNENKSHYHRSCILFEVKDSAAKNSLNSLQKILLKSLTGLDQPICNVEEGKGMLIEPLKSSNALVILDDVDDVDQMEALLPLQIHDLLSRSLILITSRDKGVLKSARVETSAIYTLNGLNAQHSRELFCFHAFSQAYPRPDFEPLVDKFLEFCKGLPLSLKVFGALLYDKEISKWEDELESLQQMLPTEISNTFRISYNSLNEEEQQIFLDIACFFIGQNRDTAISVWNGSGWRGRQGLQNLQDKSLVEVDSWNLISMHDHLRNLGRDVAEKSPPRRLSRWTENVIADLLQQSSAILVRGIKMDLSEYNEHDDVLGAIYTRRLQILDTEGSLLEHILKRVELPNILWLRWIDCPHSTLPSLISTKNLKFLQVSGSVLNSLWQREGELQGSLQLPVYLEELWADGCVNLKNIQGLAQLTKLRFLHVSGCSELEELPNLETLVSLEELFAGRCMKLKSIQGLTQLPKLRFINVSGCSELEELPSMETLVSLEELWADGCVQMKSIRGSAQPIKLRFLHVGGCSELQELPSMEALVSLEELWADRCVNLKSIRGSARPTKLRVLHVGECSKLEELPSMETFVSLEELWADRCMNVKSIRGSAPATKLRVLHVGECSKLEELPSMETFVSLEELWADRCMNLKSIRGSASATKLRVLHVGECSKLEELPSMETLVSLEELWADRCVKLKSIRGLAQPTKIRQRRKLRILHVEGCSELESIPSMETLVFLEELWADGCVKLKSIRGSAQSTKFGQRTKLRVLHVGGCFELKELPSMETLVSLEELWADRCVQLKSIRGSAPATKLRVLHVGECSKLEELPSMETLVSLEELWADKCVNLKSIRGSARPTKLRVLHLGGCSDLEELPSMETLVSLEELWADGCANLKSIRGSAQPTKLRFLRVWRVL